MPVTEECKEVSKNFTKRDWMAVIDANNRIAELTSYGVRNHQAETDGIHIAWSNGSKDWYGASRKISRGTEMRLDANETFLPMSPMRFERIKKCLDALPLYCFSTEAWTKGEVAQEEACLGWAMKQLERINREKQQEDLR
jgi:hypothetical protein